MKQHTKTSESAIHAQICAYIKLQFPNVIFTSEASGIRLTIGQAKKMKGLRSGSGLPDLWIAEPRGGYHGLFIELKAEGVTKKDGTYKTPHVAEQAEVLTRLNEKGYFTSFAVGFDHAKVLIETYMRFDRL